MRWFADLKSKLTRGKSTKPQEQDHPKAPTFDPSRGPKRYFEYFTHEEPDGMVWFEVRAYIPVRLEDGTWVTPEPVVQQSPAHSVEIARVAAQKLGREMIGEQQ